MAKITLTQPTSGYNLTAINANFAAIEAEFNNKIWYRDNPVGQPNTLQNDMDVNSHDLLNVRNMDVHGTLTANGINFSAVNSALVWRGPWNGATTYVRSDAVSLAGNSYIALTTNTNSSPPSANWDLLAQGGTGGVGSGDVVGPASSTTGAVAIYADTTGKLLANSSVTFPLSVANGGTGTTTGTVSSSSVNHTQPGTGGVTSSLFNLLNQDKISVKRFGATGDGVTNDYASIQACVNYCMTRGLTVYFPPGDYVCNSTISIDFSASATDFSYKCSIIGDGPNSSRIRKTVGTHNLITVQGGALPASYLTVEGLYLQGHDLTGAGIFCDKIAYLTIRNIVSLNLDYGMYGTNFLSSELDHCVLRFNNQNLRLERVGGGSYASAPNAITLTACVIGNAYNYGAWVVGGSTFNMVGGSVESNGIGGAAIIKYGLLISNAGMEGAVGVNLSGVYFENNVGTADVWIANSSYSTSHNITGCSFARISNVNYVANNIVLESSTVTQTLAVMGCGFKGFNTYVPSATRLYIKSVGTVNEISWAGCYFQDAVEIPTVTNFISAGSVAGVSSFNARTGAVSLLGADVTNALTYTPASLGANTFTANQAINGVNVGTISTFPAVQSTTASLVFGNTSANALMLNTAGAATSFAPTVDNAVNLGATGSTWKTFALKDTFAWNGYTIAAPLGATTTYLRNDGTWDVPTGVVTLGANTFTANQVINGTTLGLSTGVSGFIGSTNYSGMFTSASTGGVAVSAALTEKSFYPTGNILNLGMATNRWQTFSWGLYEITAPAGSTTTFLRNDGTWATPAGAVSSVSASSSSGGLTLSASPTTGAVSITLSGTPTSAGSATTAATLAGDTVTTASGSYTITAANALIALANNSGQGVFVNSSSSFAPSNDGVMTCGGATFRWSTVYATTGTINTSDARQKTELQELTPTELRVASKLAKQIGTYEFLANRGKTHIGLIAQKVVAIFQEEGLNPFTYGMVSYEEDTYGLRYEEISMFILRGQEQRLTALEAK